MKQHIYLCSRIAKDAHPLNDAAASALREAGYEVFAPHEAPYNQEVSPETLDQDVYELDMREMLRSDACVVVGRIGLDCTFEAGWFQGRNVPTFWWLPKHVQATAKPTPMLHGVPKYEDLQTVVAAVKLALYASWKDGMKSEMYKDWIKAKLKLAGIK